MRFDVPKGPAQYIETLSDFLGVDYTSASPSKRRSPNMVNLTNNRGFLETRMGYDAIGHSFGMKASLIVVLEDDTECVVKSVRPSSDSNNISISYIDPNVSNSKLRLELEGHHLKYYLETNSEGEVVSTVNDIASLTQYLVYFEIEDGESIVHPFEEIYLEGGESHRINGLWNIEIDRSNIFIVHVEDVLYELDGDMDNPTPFDTLDALNDDLSEGIYFDGKLYIFDGVRAIVYGKFGDVWEAKYLDTVGYVPTTSISRHPNGLGGSTYEDVNLLQPYRINSFLGNYSDYIYQLDSPFDDEKPTVHILNNDGSISVVEIESYDHEIGTITFQSAPPTSPVDGRDNVFVQFKVTNTETENYINHCNTITTFGYDGNNNRLFVTGNPNFRNIDWFSAIENPMYFPANNYTKIGNEPILSYLRLNDGTLAVLKETSDNDATVYYRKSGLYGDAEVFPIEAGVRTVGFVGKRTGANLLNDPIVLTSSGVFGLIGSQSKERFAMDRSYYINPRLMDEPDLNNAVSIVFKDKYYLAVNGHVYVADGRYVSRESNSTSNFQYEWFFWDNIPVRGWFIYKEELYFYTDAGEIVKFNDDYYDFNVPITQIFDTSYLDLRSITLAKTIRRITVISKPDKEMEFELSYITNDDNDDITSRDYERGEFPRVLQEKEKIKKFMFIKLRISSDKPKPINFYQIAIEYIFAGNYRGD